VPSFSRTSLPRKILRCWRRRSSIAFLLVGQSNMAGCGTVEAQDKTPHPRVLMLNMADAWVPAIDPLHFDKPAAGVGLGKTFATL